MGSVLFWGILISCTLGILVNGQQAGQINQQQPIQTQGQFQQPPPPQMQNNQGQFQQPPPPVQNNGAQFQQPPPVQNQGQFQQQPPPVQNQGQFQQQPPPVQNQGQFQQPPPPVQNQGQFQQPPPPVQNQGQFQQPPPPVQNQGQFQQQPAPVQNQGQFQQPPPVQNQGQFQQPPPVQNQGQFQQPPPPVQNQGQFQQPPPPVQNQGQFQQPPPPQQFQQPPPPVQNQGQFQQPPPPVQNQGQFQQPPPSQGEVPVPPQKKKKNKPQPPPLYKEPVPPSRNGDIIRYPSAERFKPDKEPVNSFIMLTAVISAGSRDCYFHQPITNFMVNFDVIKGGELDIGLSIIDPDGAEIIKKEPENNAEFKISVSPMNRDRSYAICLDNRKASRDEKVVGLSLALDIDYHNPSEDEKSIVEAIRSYHENMNSDEFESSIQNLNSIEDRIDSVSQKVRKIMVHFNRLKHTTNMDRIIMGHNYNRVQNWSLFQIALIAFIAMLQTMIIRSYFEGGRLNPFSMFSAKETSSRKPTTQSSTSFRA